jgi:hypothetical protein
MQVGPDNLMDLFRRCELSFSKEKELMLSGDERPDGKFCTFGACGLPSDWFFQPFGWTQCRNSYLVDPASSHMLVSKIKPCMSKYKQIYTVKLRMAH